jgi:hypothetical protein
MCIFTNVGLVPYRTHGYHINTSIKEYTHGYQVCTYHSIVDIWWVAREFFVYNFLFVLIPFSTILRLEQFDLNVHAFYIWQKIIHNIAAILSLSQQ